MHLGVRVENPFVIKFLDSYEQQLHKNKNKQTAENKWGLEKFYLFFWP